MKARILLGVLVLLSLPGSSAEPGPGPAPIPKPTTEKPVIRDEPVSEPRPAPTAPPRTTEPKLKADPNDRLELRIDAGTPQPKLKK